MRKYKYLSYVFVILAILLSNIMCATTAYNYASMLCGIKHQGFSAPANVALLNVIPYGIEIIICIVLAIVFYQILARTHPPLSERSERRRVFSKAKPTLQGDESPFLFRKL